MGESVGILSVRTVLPDGELSHAQLADLQRTTEADVDRVIGSARVLVSSKSAEDFAIEAGRACLEAAGVSPEQVDAVMFCNVSKRAAIYNEAGKIQHAIGATNAFTIDLGHNCAESLVALRCARALIHDDPTVKHVLVVSGEQWAEITPRRGLDLIKPGTHPNVFSDGGAAVLIGPSERGALLGFGFSSNGKYCDLIELKSEVVDGKTYERGQFKENFPDEKQLAMDLTRLFRTALQRCLRDVGIQREQLAHVVFPYSGPPVQTGFARALGLPPERVVRMDGDPTHMGVPDIIHAIETLYRTDRGKPGDLVLLAARSLGIMRCGVMRL